MTIAMPVWQEKISPVLDTARVLRIYEVLEGVPVVRGDIALDGSFDGLVKTVAASSGILICGALSRMLEQRLTTLGVAVHPWVMGDCDHIAACFLAGALNDRKHAMPGCHRRGAGQCRHHGRPFEK